MGVGRRIPPAGVRGDRAEDLFDPLFTVKGHDFTSYTVSHLTVSQARHSDGSEASPLVQFRKVSYQRICIEHLSATLNSPIDPPLILV